MNIGNADIHEAADCIGVGRDAERDRWFVGRRTTPDIDNEPGVPNLEVPRRAFAVASAQNATSEDRFVKSKRSLDVGDGEKVCDGNAVLWRHLIGFLLDLHLAHRQLLFGFCGHKVKRRVENLPTTEAGAADKKVAVIIIFLVSPGARWRPRESP